MGNHTYKVQRVSGMGIGDEELLADLRAVATAMGKPTVGQKEYRRVGKYADTTARDRFGSWNKALLAAGLRVSNEVNLSDERLFENLLVLWQHYGRQPRRAELAASPSSISQTPYSRRFGSWSSALAEFVAYANGNNVDPPSAQAAPSSRRESGREPSLRLRWRILHRDRFTCCACGASPAITPTVELHVDHVVPWSKGGNTVLENLRTLCSQCNLGKSNTEG